MILPSSKADWPAIYFEAWEERAAIIEYYDNKPRLVAEFIAEDAIRKMALEEGCIRWEELT